VNPAVKQKVMKWMLSKAQGLTNELVTIFSGL
jgi:hypothetical protein